MKITRIRFYHNPRSSIHLNQGAPVITIETDEGITGIGEGGSKDTILQCGAMIIGEDPMRIDHLWQMLFRGYFYPAGRERLAAIGALEIALWDIKGKALGAPVYELLGGLSRDYVECYSTFFPAGADLKERARACIEAGFRAFRHAVAIPLDGKPFDPRLMIRRTHQECIQIREGVGEIGAWTIDYHTRLEFPDAVRLSSLLEPLEPYFVEDMIRTENVYLYERLRTHTNTPIAVGEQFGTKWDLNWLLENHLIDYARVTLPNAGGITEYMKIAALCETHYVGLIPHFTGPISQAALVHCCLTFSGPAMMEVVGCGPVPSEMCHLPECYAFHNGKMWPNDRPGIGVTLDTTPLELIAEITERARPIPMLSRHDGSITNW